MLVNLTRQSTIATSVEVARNPWQRIKGLLGRKGMAAGSALIITRCQSIHMVFMQFPIDVIFCDAHNKVVGLCVNIKPFGFSPIFFKASHAIELPGGRIDASKTQIGDQIQLT
jgi:uncharacterized membrane protein (UPF0127 family)